MPSSPYATSSKTTTTELPVHATRAPSNDCCLSARRFATDPLATFASLDSSPERCRPSTCDAHAGRVPYPRRARMSLEPRQWRFCARRVAHGLGRRRAHEQRFHQDRGNFPKVRIHPASFASSQRGEPFARRRAGLHLGPDGSLAANDQPNGGGAHVKPRAGEQPPSSCRRQAANGAGAFAVTGSSRVSRATSTSPIAAPYSKSRMQSIATVSKRAF